MQSLTKQGHAVWMHLQLGYLKAKAEHSEICRVLMDCSDLGVASGAVSRVRCVWHTSAINLQPCAAGAGMIPCLAALAYPPLTCNLCRCEHIPLLEAVGLNRLKGCRGQLDACRSCCNPLRGSFLQAEGRLLDGYN